MREARRGGEEQEIERQREDERGRRGEGRSDRVREMRRRGKEG